MTAQRARCVAVALALLAATSLLAACGGSEPITATMEKPPAPPHPAPPAPPDP